MIKFNKHNVTNTETNQKSRVSYHSGNHISGQACVTIYAKDYGHALGQIIGDAYQNNTDSQTDYFETGTVRLFEDSPLFAAALKRAELNAAAYEIHYEKQREKSRQKHAMA